MELLTPSGQILPRAQNDSMSGCPTRGPDRERQRTGAANQNAFTKDTDMLLVLMGMTILFGALIVVAILYNVVAIMRRKRRLATKQHDFSPNRSLKILERDLIEAPLFRVRHNRQFRPFSKANVDFGTLPGRLPTLLILGYTGANIAFIAMAIDWRTTTFYQFWDDMCNRTGDVSTINMIPLFLTAGRNNPLIRLCDVSFDTFNLVHRWIGRIAVIEATLHTIAWMVKSIGCGNGLNDPNHFLIVSGTIAFIPFLFLLFHSPATLRHISYEFFLYSHIIASAVAIAGLWLHVVPWPLMTRAVLVAIIFWVGDRVIRFARLLYANIGLTGISKAQVDILPGDCIRVTIFPVRPWKFHTGQHLYVYMPRSGWFTSHPFSIAWSDERADPSTEAGINGHSRSMSLLMKRHGGFTDKLYQQAMNSSMKCTTTCLVEGPYGLNEEFRAYGTVLLFAGGYGIAHQLPQVRDLVEHYDTDKSLARRVVLFWFVQYPEHLDWIKDWVEEIQALPRCSEVLKIRVFVTRASKELEPQTEGCMEVIGSKPDMDALFDEEILQRVGAMAVATCGAGGLADEVRRAARAQMVNVGLDIFEEASTW